MFCSKVEVKPTMAYSPRARSQAMVEEVRDQRADMQDPRDIAIRQAARLPQNLLDVRRRLRVARRRARR